MNRLELLASLFQTSTLAWSVYFLLSFFGFEYLADIMLIPAFLWSLVSLGSLPVLGILWVVKHVRITIV